MKQPSDIEALKGEVSEVRKQFPALSPDNAFVLWFLRAFLTDDYPAAVDAITGSSNDKGIDAIFIDDEAKQVFILQGKYRATGGVVTEKRTDLNDTARLGVLLHGKPKEFEEFARSVDGQVKKKLTAAFERIRRGYGLFLYFITTGKVTPGSAADAEYTALQASGKVDFKVFQCEDVLARLADYLDGVAPAVPSLDLPIEYAGLSDGAVRSRDPNTGFESWVFSMNGRDVGDLYNKAGIRIFARNIRGFLGTNTEINKEMRRTLERDPGHFWYFNNGVTIVCDTAKRIQESGRDTLRVLYPQIINGQQTTRILSEHGNRKSRVLVRVISIPRNGTSGRNQFERVVEKIVEATNWQNAINQADLKANEAEQVRLERELRKLGYHYLRKRMTKGEARKTPGAQALIQIKKEEMARAVAACTLDPVVVRQGITHLFEGEKYDQVFDPRRSPRDYLFYYWLGRAASYAAEGKPERAYAKWVVLNFVSDRLESKIRSSEARHFFLGLCERRNYFKDLYRLFNIAFRSVKAFYLSERGVGEEAADVSSFFKRARLKQRFGRYWRSNRNKQRKAFERALASELAWLRENVKRQEEWI